MISYKETTSKKGKRLIICKLDELLMDFYHEKTMEDVAAHARNGQYIIHCPFCKAEGHTKHKLYIKDDLSVGNCFVCGRAFLNESEETVDEYKVDIPDIFEEEYPEEFKVISLQNDGPWGLDKFEQFDSYSERGVNYLLGRHRYMGDLWKKLGFKFFRDNVAMPFYSNGKLIYYQIRFIDATQKDDVRYFFPPVKPGARPPYVIENFKVGERPKVILVEGIFDAIAAMIQAPGYTPIALMGCNPSPYQIEYIRQYMPSKILIWLDETKLSLEVKEKVSKKIDYCPIGIIESDGPDPEEIMKDRMSKGLPLQWIGPDFIGTQPRRNMFNTLNIGFDV